MKIKNPRFVTSAYSYHDYPNHNLPEIAFSGRSNVGKSSMINKLLNRKKLARISSQPGRTQSINFYNIDERFFLIDLPGYGFARVPEKIKDQWAALIEDYLHNRPNLAGIVQIVDARHKPTQDDIMMINWLIETGFPIMVAATKVDKISKGQYHKQKKLIMNTLGLEEDDIFTFFSAKTGEGLKDLSRFIDELVHK